MSDFIWVEKYRPKTIDECILPESIKKTFNDFLNRGEIPNMLLAGPPGIPLPTYNSSLERLLRNSKTIADSSSPAIIKIKLSNRYTPGVLWSNLASRVRRNLKFRRSSLKDSTLSWTKNGAKVIRKYLLN
jgi:hypothetical protein